ncbi:uncharacterized protein [Paramisgurnus dabryanus]|uniref:uncharacterized protein isoform X2 n=1 Tax=Paramisgurnus dabryanus TaxID=90735 RepID=UPI0031F40B40
MIAKIFACWAILATSAYISVSSKKCTTRWFDRDDPSGMGDYELLADLLTSNPGYICRKPIGIEAQTISGLSASQTGNVFQVYDATHGFACVNAAQGGGQCADYKVRFICPEEFCSSCRTPWIDRDNPDGVGDFETLDHIQIEYPLQVCPQPIAIEVTTLSGIQIQQTSSIFQLFDPLQGFSCVNGNLSCQDYRVRFTCPRSFCQTKCVTRWFDRDDPSGNGDFEYLSDLLKEYPGLICQNPIGIEAQTVSGLQASQTGNVFQVYNTISGFACVNEEQGGVQCDDYKVRFLCPDSFCSSCRTPWIDRDNPDGVGDFETLDHIQIEYPLQVCPKPIAIEVTTLSGTQIQQTSSIFQTYDPLQGFSCVNGKLSCKDYRVRFTCPRSFCQTKCVTRWFDRDDPSGNGDFEYLSDLLKEYPGLICQNPIGIEAQTVSGLHVIQTGNVFQVYNAISGFACVNSEQGAVQCDDYKVRFLCPDSFCSSCRTPWIDRDNPDGVGDFETLDHIQIEYPLLVCPQPIAIEVTTLSGIQIQQTSSIFQTFDPLQGFSCVNGNLSCQDYRVRFTCPRSFCQTKCVTRWFDRDDPSGNGDFEYLSDLLNENPGLICQNPIGIEAQTVAGLQASQTGNIFQVYNAISGFACVNSEQGGVQCDDYKVRFLCPDSFCSSCRTPWIDRDNPGGVGDFETLNHIQIEYPLQVCPQPIAIEVTTLSGIQIQQTSSIFQLFDPLQGFSCVNGKVSCEDYRVRFTCPQSFCQTKCVTRWFDRDDPSGNGDFEYLSDLLNENPGLICQNPIGIEAQTVSGLHVSQTGNVFQAYNAISGFACVNEEQGGVQCDDYKVRFLCPDSFCSICRKPWIDRDDPSGVGDYETLTDILAENPQQACPQPIAIEVATISGTTVMPTGNNFVYDPLQGFSCMNTQQTGGACQDYMVRFTCPKSFC